MEVDIILKTSGANLILVVRREFHRSQQEKKKLCASCHFLEGRKKRIAKALFTQQIIWIVMLFTS